MFFLNLFSYNLYLNNNLFFDSSNEQLVNIEYPDGVCLFILVVDDSLGLFMQVLIFSSKHSKSVYIIKGTFIDFSP